MYRERKSAQIAAWFLTQAGGRMAHLKLVKLMYLADRQAMADTGSSLTGDRFVSMRNGPVTSLTLDYINGLLRPSPDGWDSWISARENHEVSVVERGADELVLDELSTADRDVLRRVWQDFGHMDKWDLVDYTHDHCKEWTDPHGSSAPIPPVRIFEALGKSKAEAELLAEQLEEQESLDRVFADL